MRKILLRLWIKDSAESTLFMIVKKLYLSFKLLLILQRWLLYFSNLVFRALYLNCTYFSYLTFIDCFPLHKYIFESFLVFYD